MSLPGDRIDGTAGPAITATRWVKEGVRVEDVCRAGVLEEAGPYPVNCQTHTVMKELDRGFLSFTIGFKPYDQWLLLGRKAVRVLARDL